MTQKRRNKYTTGASSSQAASTASPSKRRRRENKEASALEEAEGSLPLDIENDDDANSIDEQGAQLVSPPAADRSPEERNPKQQRRTRAAPPRKSQTQIECNNGNDGVGNGEEAVDAVFIGPPIPQKEAKLRWPLRYRIKNAQRRSIPSDGNDESEEKMQARVHYSQAKVDGRVLYNLNDCAHVQAAPGEPNYVCKIVEIFEGVDGNRYFTAQWFYRPSDTVIGKAYKMDNKYVFFSEIKDDNPLDCLVQKLTIAMLDLEENNRVIPQCNYYCDMLYLLPYSTFVKLPPEYRAACSESLSTISSDIDSNAVNSEPGAACGTNGNEVTLLDLYSGCGAMSTGLCLGAKKSGANLVTRWAVDINQFACKSLELNHPETKVRNEKAEDFLELLKEWRRLCVSFSLVANGNGADECQPYEFRNVEEEEEDDDDNDDDVDDLEAFEVEKIINICYGDPKNNEKCGLYFMVHWKGYDNSDDTWEPVGGLIECGRAVKRFVAQGYKDKILPLQGDVDVICGGPPCQGISGFNRFRNRENPLADVKNKQLLVFMDIVDYLKPKFVLMENVVDILKFAEGFLGRYALGRLIEMKYQTRMGLLAAGCYGLPQFRMRFFLWGALHCEKLPQYPLPTHDVVVRGVVPVEFESHVVAYDAGLPVNLEKKLTLEDAISDLPRVGNDENRDVMGYDKEPCTEFQRLIRLNKDASPSDMDFLDALFDHRPLQLNMDDYKRTCRIPKKKGANFRDLPGVRVRPDKRVEFDPEVERVMLESGKPLVPDYAMTFVHGSSTKPFARLWWDETVPTVVTRAEPHNQAILHPTQDRVLSVRENARLQGFPDYYRLCGPVKERYIQVGNAVAVPVARALGYSLGLALQGSAGDEPLFSLPKRFPHLVELPSSASSDNDA